MTSLRRLAALTLLAVAVSTAATPHAQTSTPTDVPVLLAEAKRAFDGLEYDKAVAALDRLVAMLEPRPPQDPARKDLAQTYELRARSRFGLGDQAGAGADFVSLLKIAPSYTLSADVSPRVVAVFNDALKATVTTLHVTVAPETAEVTLDGAAVAAGTTLPVAVGAHVVAAKQLGYREASVSVQADPEAPAEATLTLERVSAVLTLKTTPSGVEVLIDGVSHGKTTATGAAAAASAPMIVADVVPGTHLVEFRRDCYLSAERRVVVERPADYPLEPVTLDPAVAKLSVRANQPGAQVYVDGQARGVAPYAAADLCEGDHVVELRSQVGRYLKRVRARTGDTIDLNGALKPAIALVSSPAAAAVSVDLRVAVEHALEASTRLTVFAPPADQVEQASKALQLPSGWLAFDAMGRALGTAAEIAPPLRQDVSAKLARTFDVQGIGSVTVPVAAERSRLVVSILSAGSARPDVVELNLDDPESIRSAIVRIDRAMSFFRPSIGLAAMDVADVGAVVSRVDPGSAAAAANIAVGDIVAKVGGQAVADASALATQLAASKAGDKVALDLQSRGAAKHAELPVTLTPRLAGLLDRTLLTNTLLVDLRSRLPLVSDRLEESVVRLNIAAMLVRLELWSDARAELQRVTLPDGAGVSNGTVQYLIGLCADRLGNRADAEAAWKAAAASDATLTEDGPPIKDLAQARLASR